MNTPKRNPRREQWLTQYEQLLNAARPETTGKIDWDTAIFLFNSGKSAQDAASQYIANHPAIFQGENQ